jgi:hypothetical protein
MDAPHTDSQKADHGAHPTEIPIQIDHRPYKAPKPAMTGAELKALAGITGDYDIWYETPGPNDDVKVRDDASFELRTGAHFYSMPRTINPGR